MPCAIVELSLCQQRWKLEAMSFCFTPLGGDLAGTREAETHGFLRSRVRLDDCGAPQSRQQGRAG
jgi:hypothetical protein